MFAFCLTAGLGLLINSVTAHPQPGVRLLAEDECTTSIPAFQSYHIHTLFWQNNGNSTKAAEKLEAAFMEEFNLTREANSCLVRLRVGCAYTFLLRRYLLSVQPR